METPRTGLLKSLCVPAQALEDGIYQSKVTVLTPIDDIDAIIFRIQEREEFKVICIKLHGRLVGAHGLGRKMVSPGDRAFSIFFRHFKCESLAIRTGCITRCG